MRMDAQGMVMHENTDRLPHGCVRIAEDIEFTIQAGSLYAADRPGSVFGMSQHDIRVPACSRVTVTFVNEDAVRHQWMVHGLPNYLYPMGMFHIEASGGQTVRGTFIVPAEDQTYLVHCDMSQHMEKGMRAQLVVGNGSGNLWGVPGVSDWFYRDDYFPDRAPILALVSALAGLLLTLLLLTKNGREKQPHA